MKWLRGAKEKFAKLIGRIAIYNDSKKSGSLYRTN